MDLNGLIWTKNVKPLNGEDWAYYSIPTIYPDLKIFALHWRNFQGGDEINANTPQQNELIILRQRSKVTHIVKVLDKQFSLDKNAGDEFNIYRLIQVAWITDNWDTPPDTNKVFDCVIKFPRNGKAIKLENIHIFQEHWSKKELAFQHHIQSALNIH